MSDFYIDNQKNIYIGDMLAGDRLATAEEVSEYSKDKRDYKLKRLSEYPKLGDMIDAFCKAEQGNNTELKTLMAKREEIKSKYPKEVRNEENTSDNTSISNV